jgi:hypothetical protein
LSDAPPRRKLPSPPSLDDLKKEIRQLIQASPGLQIAAARKQLAQEYGYASWADLVRLVQAIALPQNQIAQGRFAEAQRLARDGHAAEALAAMLWCYDRGMKEAVAMGGVRRSFLLGALVRLGETHPPARQALLERRDAARLNLASAAGDDDDWPDFVALNHYLGEDAATLAYHDEAKTTGAHVPPARRLHRVYLEAQRYAEALEAQPYETYLQKFEQSDHPLAKREQVVLIRAMMSADMLEVLAGTGDLVQAEEVVVMMLQADRSVATLARLRKSATRAGHPELVPAE